MILEITGLERGTIKSKAGKELTGLTINGIKFDRDGNEGDEYEKFLMDWKNSDEIATLEEAGVGARVEMKSVKDGNFWNLDEVIILEEGTGQTASDTPSTKKEPATQTPDGPATAQRENPTPPAAEVLVVGSSESVARIEALKAAVNFTDALLSSDPRWSKLMPVSKATVDIVSQMTLENASKFESFIKGDFNTDVKSDDSDLNTDGVDAKEPTLPGDDD